MVPSRCAFDMSLRFPELTGLAYDADPVLIAEGAQGRGQHFEQLLRFAGASIGASPSGGGLPFPQGRFNHPKRCPGR